MRAFVVERSQQRDNSCVRTAMSNFSTATYATTATPTAASDSCPATVLASLLSPCLRLGLRARAEGLVRLTDGTAHEARYALTGEAASAAARFVYLHYRSSQYRAPCHRRHSSGAVALGGLRAPAIRRCWSQSAAGVSKGFCGRSPQVMWLVLGRRLDFKPMFE